MRQKRFWELVNFKSEAFLLRVHLEVLASKSDAMAHYCTRRALKCDTARSAATQT
jgi:hypothetical protein